MVKRLHPRVVSAFNEWALENISFTGSVFGVVSRLEVEDRFEFDPLGDHLWLYVTDYINKSSGRSTLPIGDHVVGVVLSSGNHNSYGVSHRRLLGEALGLSPASMGSEIKMLCASVDLGSFMGEEHDDGLMWCVRGERFDALRVASELNKTSPVVKSGNATAEEIVNHALMLLVAGTL